MPEAPSYMVLNPVFPYLPKVRIQEQRPFINNVYVTTTIPILKS